MYPNNNEEVYKLCVEAIQGYQEVLQELILDVYLRTEDEVLN